MLGLATTHLLTPSDVDEAAEVVAAVAGLPVGAVVASSLSSEPVPHLALVVLSAVPVAPDVAVAVGRAAAAEGAADEARRRAEGGEVDRVAVFPGRERLTGVLPVADVLALGGLDAVLGLGGVVVPAGAELDTRDHVRPRLAAGRLVLDVQPARGGRFVPFELPVQHSCCSAH